MCEYFFKARIVVVVCGIMAIVIFSGPSYIWTSSTVYLSGYFRNVVIELADSIITCLVLIRSIQIYMHHIDL
jgi:hypothetical protein